MISRAIPAILPALAVFLLAAAHAAPAKAPLAAKAPVAAKAATKASVPAKATAPEPPITAESLLTQSQAATGRGDIDLALRLAQSAIVADPARPGSYVALGDIYAQAGQQDYARNFYDAALGIDPAEPSALKALSALDGGSSKVNATR